MKKIIMAMAMLAFILSIGFAFASEKEYYEVYQVNFANEVPDSLFVSGGECATTQCSGELLTPVELYNGNAAVKCWEDFVSNRNAEAFYSCMDTAKLDSNVHPITKNKDYVVIKLNPDASFGHLTWFSPNGDTYIPKTVRTRSYTCNYDTCFDENIYGINFNKGNGVAIAEVNSVNIKNLDDDTKPIQIEVPVQIEETVCSAYRLANGNYEVPNFPQGYSDLNANTNIKLTIQNNENNEMLLTEDVNLPIEADTCAALHAFTWTPPKDLLDTEIKFRVETDVIDEQVTQSKIDFHEVTETIYPQDLSGQCWNRAYDFVLTNDPNQALSTSLVTITKGETVYASFNAGAWKGNEITPLETYWEIKFDNNVIKEGTFQTRTNDVQEITVDLTDEISVVEAGNYKVGLLTRATNAQGCDMNEPVIQNVNLDVREVDMFEVEFEVSDDSGNKVNGAEINFNLIDSHEYFAVEPVYDRTQTTDSNGETTFEEVTRGEYTYTITKSGFQSVTNNKIVGSNAVVIVTLSKGNSAPTIDLPHSKTADIKSTLELDLEDYVHDFEDAFSDLELSVEKTSGSADAKIENSKLIVSASSVGDVNLEVTVTDSQGLSAKDSMLLSFIDNSAPVINSFDANPTNGDAPFTTTFEIDVYDADGDTLTCTINYDDGSANEEGNCDEVDGTTHTYDTVGTYNVVLTVSDGKNDPVEQTEQVFVFDRNYASPHIGFFTLESSNGDYIPTDLTLAWEVTHPDNKETTCTLRINGVSENVDCEDTKEINNFDRLGESIFILLADDGEHQVSRKHTKVFEREEDEENTPPVIDEFTANATEGLVGMSVTFTSKVSDPDGDSLRCSIDFGDGVTIKDSECDVLQTAEHQYNNEGTFTATFSVTDGVDTTSKSIEVKVRENKVPVINRFEASPDSGRSPLIVSFYIDVTDPDGDNVSCKIDFGDGTSSQQDSCNLLNGVTHQYIGIGSYTAKLVAEDELGKEVSATEVITVISQKPKVEYLTLSTSTGSYILPNDITLQWKATHPDKVSITCDLIVNGVKTSNVGCQNSKTLSDYNTEGTGKFEIVARDEYGNSDSLSREQFFGNVPLTLENLDLEISSVIEPGDFKFYLEVSDESIARRQLYLEPQIRCSGVTIPLSRNRKLETSAKSSVYIGSVTRFEFITNTLDYNANIPKDTHCTFSVRVTDKYGTDLELNEDVRFEYSEKERQIQSIRGSGTDIANYMQTTLRSNIQPGFNSVEFNLVNNELEDKKITVSLMSRELGISYVLDERLEPDSVTEVQIPIYISHNVESGMYPIRISFTDENEGKQTRYTYINIE